VAQEVDGEASTEAASKEDADKPLEWPHHKRMWKWCKRLREKPRGKKQLPKRE
jgi:hypothetical protein